MITLLLALAALILGIVALVDTPRAPRFLPAAVICLALIPLLARFGG